MLPSVASLSFALFLVPPADLARERQLPPLGASALAHDREVEAADAPPSARHITLADALRIVGTTHPSIYAHQADLTASDATSRVARARMLPAIAVGDMLSYSDMKFHSGGPAAAAAGTAQAAESGSPFAALPQYFGANIFYAGLKQPVVNLLPLAYDYRGAKAQAAADAELLAYRRLSLATEVRVRFASLFRARALAETAEGSERALSEQTDRARAQLAAGAATETDLLRLKAALAGARQQRVTAESNASVERASLLELLGLANEADSIEFVRPRQFIESDALPARPLLRQTALSKRADLSAQIFAAESLRLCAKARALDLLPKVELQLNYLNLYGEPRNGSRTHIDGNVFAAGISASWPVFTWGARWETHRAARARAQAARFRLEESRRQIGQDVARRFATVEASDSGVLLAQAQVADAEEAFRVMVATLQAEAATTTDLLDAEAGQTRARNALIEAHYSALIARLELAQALGTNSAAHD